MISVGSAQAITADTLLTSVLIVTLRRRRTGIRRTDSMIDVLILYAVSTGEFRATLLAHYESL